MKLATGTTCKLPIDATTSISLSLNSANPRRRSAAKTSKAERRGKIVARQFARQSTASMPFTGRLFATLREEKKGAEAPAPQIRPLSANEVICEPATMK